MNLPEQLSPELIYALIAEAGFLSIPGSLHDYLVYGIYIGQKSAVNISALDKIIQ